MIIYSGSKTDFMGEVETQRIATTIRDTIQEKMHRTTPESEYKSWTNSLQYMYMVMNDPKIPDTCGVAIEYNLPNTAKRVDFLVSGYDDIHQPNVVVIELKQWSQLNKVDGMDGLVETYTGGGMRKVVHPSYQAWSYAQMIRDYNEYAQSERVNVWPCAYLHNYVRETRNDPLDDEIYADYLKAAPAYDKADVGNLRAYIKRVVTRGDEGQILYEIDHGKIKPSKSLQDTIASMVENNPEFCLIDDQKVVFEEILELSRACERDGRRRTYIAEGGPGTGKTVIAINLLAQLTQEGVFAQYCSRNSAPRDVYRQKLKGKRTMSSVDNMFKGSGSYIDVPPSSIGCVICDEAHRLNEKSGLYANQGENQVKEIIEAARLSVFFIDESQRVTVRDIGSVEAIRDWAEALGSEVTQATLTSQFRCNGSDGYLAWLDDVLEIRETANFDLAGIDYDFRVMDTPDEVRREIVARNADANKARLLAGYCWNWPTRGRADTDFHDIVIGDFEMSWNLAGGELFALSETSINEVGCIHTTQGLEFEYVGVIVGDDMRYEDGHIVCDFTRRARTDTSVRGLKKMMREDPERACQLADEIIKNTYRTLMTRGMRGCYVYATDPGLRDYLRGRILDTFGFRVKELKPKQR